MSSREETFFLSVLADHLNGRSTNPVAGLDWDAVYDVAERHQVSALVYAQCGAFLPPEAELRFLRDYATAVADHAARQKVASDLERVFTLHQIPYVPVKGLVVAESYPQPELRTMGDIDVIVKAEDKEQAHALLLALGFHNTQKQDHEWIYLKDSCEIELHHRLLYDDPTNGSSLRLLADRIWEFVQPVPGSSRCELDKTFHFLFLVMHLKKHVIASGAGFRQFMDLAVTAQKWRIDWSQTEKWLADVDLTVFFKRGMSLCRQWFELETPPAAVELPPETEEDIRQQIFRNGVFGFTDQANRHSLVIDQINAGGRDGVRRRLQMCQGVLARPPDGVPEKTWSMLFPGYEYLRKSNEYGFVDRRPWLLPVAWGYRFIHCLWGRGMQIAVILLLRRGTVRKRKENLKNLGLSGHQ